VTILIRCTRCGYSKPPDRFYPRSDYPGLRSWCKDCCREWQRAYYWRTRQRSRSGNAAEVS